jgi:hypothetical protein
MGSAKLNISFCTVCLNNESQLQQTLPANLEDNEDYDNLEFVLVDGNESDQLGKWIKNNLGKYLESGRLVYYRLAEPGAFHPALAKNTSIKLGSGEIVCHINASEYTGLNMAAYVNEVFKVDNNITLISNPVTFHEPTNDHPAGYMVGKLCLKKNAFMAVGGYDERMLKPGNEDIDLLNRLKLHGTGKMLITNPVFGRSLNQKTGKGFSVCKSLNNVVNIYISHCTPAISEIIFLYKDQYFEKGMLIDHSRIAADNYCSSYKKPDFQYRYSLREIEKRGKWKESIPKNVIHLYSEPNHNICLKSFYRNRYDVLESSVQGARFHAVTNPWVMEKLLTLNSIYYNQLIMEDNVQQKRVQVNPSGFRKVLLTSNFQQHSSCYN